MPVVLKLGGSVLTDKTDPETVDDAALESAAAAVARFDGDLVLVHGGGSFGHYHADRHGVTTEAGTRDATAVVDVHDAMTRLNTGVVAALQDAGVGAVPVRPFSAAHRDETGKLAVHTDAVETMLAEGFTPVLHGDVVAHAGSGATILSGDELVVALGEGLSAKRVGVCAAVPGVLDADGAVVDRIDSFEAVASALSGSDATDVTGGMAAKVRALLDLDAPAHVFAPEDLTAFLDGESPGTAIRGGDR